jgi:hypothetical protein
VDICTSFFKNKISFSHFPLDRKTAFYKYDTKLLKEVFMSRGKFRGWQNSKIHHAMTVPKCLISLGFKSFLKRFFMEVAKDVCDSA